MAEPTLLDLVRMESARALARLEVLKGELQEVADRHHFLKVHIDGNERLLADLRKIDQALSDYGTPEKVAEHSGEDDSDLPF